VALGKEAGLVKELLGPQFMQVMEHFDPSHADKELKRKMSAKKKGSTSQNWLLCSGHINAVFPLVTRLIYLTNTKYTQLNTYPPIPYRRNVLLNSPHRSKRDETKFSAGCVGKKVDSWCLCIQGHDANNTCMMNKSRLLRRKRKTEEQEGCLGLPPEIWLQIFGYLDEAGAIAASQVCRLWKSLVFDADRIVFARWPGAADSYIATGTRGRSHREKKSGKRKKKRKNGKTVGGLPRCNLYGCSLYSLLALLYSLCLLCLLLAEVWAFGWVLLRDDGLTVSMRKTKKVVVVLTKRLQCLINKREGKNRNK